MPDPEHFVASVKQVDCGVLTVSDTRTIDTDHSGKLIVELLGRAGHRVISQDIVPDEPDAITEGVRKLIEDQACRAILITGGTGPAPRDITPDVVAALFVKRLDGFGELFRQLSYEEIGAAAMLSRATAGVVGGTVIFCMPGSTAAVRLAMERLILPTLRHIVGLLDS